MATEKNKSTVSEEERLLRIRARRRLIGAMILVLVAVAVLPMLMDREPRPLEPTVDIRIPRPESMGLWSDPVDPDAPALRTESKLSAAKNPPPREPATESAPKDTANAKNSPAPINNSVSIPKEKTASHPIEKKEVTAKNSLEKTDKIDKPEKSDEVRAKAILEGKDSPAADTSEKKSADKSADKVAEKTPEKPLLKTKYFIQFGTFDSRANAESLRQRLNNLDVTASLEPIQINGSPKIKVRAGPFDSQIQAQAILSRLQAQGIAGNLVTQKI